MDDHANDRRTVKSEQDARQSVSGTGLINVLVFGLILAGLALGLVYAFARMGAGG